MKETTSSTALTVLEKNKFELVPFTTEMKEAIAEELDGIDNLRFDMVKTPTAGGLAFEVPGDDPENPDVTKEIVGIIVHHHKVNAFWEGEFDGVNNQPLCSSRDGKVGVEPETGCTNECATCPRNAFGSDKNARGKACKNMEHLYFLRSGSPLPIVLVVPPSSLKAWQEYLSKGIVLRGKRLNQVLTKVTLKKEQNADGIQFSKYVFTKVDNLTPAEIEYIKPMATALKEICQAVQTPVYFDSPGGSEDQPREVFTEIDSDGDLPF